MNSMGWTPLGTALLLAGGAGSVALDRARWADRTQAQAALLAPGHRVGLQSAIALRLNIASCCSVACTAALAAVTPP